MLVNTNHQLHINVKSIATNNVCNDSCYPQQLTISSCLVSSFLLDLDWFLSMLLFTD